MKRGGIERVFLRRLSPTFGFAEVRLPGVNLTGLRIDAGAAGIRITAPTRQDDQGRMWPVYALQPGVHEEVEAEIRRVWARTETRP